MHLSLDVPLGTRARLRHPTQHTEQDATVCSYYAQGDGVYVQFDGAPEVYGLPQSYVRDPQCFHVLRRGNDRAAPRKE